MWHRGILLNSPKLRRGFRSSRLAELERSKFFAISREKTGQKYSSRIGTYLQFSDAAAAARTECWEDSACERGEKQVEVVEDEEEEEEKEEEIEKNRRYLHAKLTRVPCHSWGIGLQSRPEAPGSGGWYRGERSANPAPPPLASGGLGLAATQPQGRC